jgi:pimeloyl-ACP methyl ester carboxylesterase
MPQINVNGIDLFYNTRGSGEPLLLLAGFACDHTYWSLVVPALAARYQLILVDNRGMGRSSDPDRPYSIRQMADDAAALLDHLNIPKAHVAGHSMGGQIAQELALSRPELVQSLLLVATWSKGDGPLRHTIEVLGDLPRYVPPELYYKVVYPWIFTDAFYAVPDQVDDLIQLALAYPYQPSNQGHYHQSRAILKSDTSDRLHAIQAPTLVLIGRDDILTPIKHSEQLVQGIPNAELVVLDRSGHGLLIESPEAVSSAILTFLTTLEKRLAVKTAATQTKSALADS